MKKMLKVVYKWVYKKYIQIGEKFYMSINALSMSCSFWGGVSSTDSEYQEIIRKLRSYGVSPSGDFYADKAKLNKIEQAKDSQNAQFSDTQNKKENMASDVQNTSVTDKGEGTDQLAMLNRLQLGLL